MKHKVLVNEVVSEIHRELLGIIKREFINGKYIEEVVSDYFSTLNVNKLLKNVKEELRK